MAISLPLNMSKGAGIIIADKEEGVRKSKDSIIVVLSIVTPFMVAQATRIDFFSIFLSQALLQ